MFNVRPNARVPGFRVSPLVDAVPGFRVAADGSPEPSPPDGVHAPAQLADRGIYPPTFPAFGPSSLTPPSQDLLRNALDQMAGLYARVPARPLHFDGVPRPAEAMMLASPTQATAREEIHPGPYGPSTPMGSQGHLPWAAAAPPRLTPALFRSPEDDATPTAPPEPTSAPFVRVADTEPAARSDDVLIAQQSRPQTKQAPKKAGPKVVESPGEALSHYLKGSGDPVEYPISNINTRDVTPSQFPRIAEILRSGKPGTYEIEDTMPFSTPNFPSRYYVGNITLNTKGKLVLNPDGTYSFTGELGAGQDRYRFYPSNHRDWLAETATTVGTWLPGREYDVNITGKNPLSRQGRYQLRREDDAAPAPAPN